MGNMSEIMGEAVKLSDISEIINTAHLVLTTYCPDNPYRPLQDFVSASGQVQSNGEVLEVEDCDEEEED